MSIEPAEAELSKADALRAVNGQSDASDYVIRIPPAAHPINRGLGGTSVLVRKPSSDTTYFVKKIGDEVATENDFSCTVNLAQQSSSLGLAPNLLYVDQAYGLLVFEGLPDTWRFGTTKAFRDPNVSGNAARALKAIHGTDVLPSTLTPHDRIRFLVKKLDSSADQIGKSVYPEYYHTMLDWTSRIEIAIEAAGADLRPCKGENNLSDFMIGQNGSVRLVDFDHAANGDPYADLGTLANEFCRTDDNVNQLVEAYEGTANRSLVARVKLYMVVSAFQLGLWGVVSQLRSPGTEIEYQKYGQNQLLYCRSAISRWDLGRLLREI